jgi:hypothetical protein
MSLSFAAVAQAAAFPLPSLLPPPVVVHRSVVIVAAGGRDLSWPQERIASALLRRSSSLSFNTKIQFSGNLLVGKAYTAQLGLKPGDEFEIKLGRKQIQLILLGTAEEE